MFFFSFYIFFSVTCAGKSFSGVKILDNTTGNQSMKTENEKLATTTIAVIAQQFYDIKPLFLGLVVSGVVVI